MGLFGKLFGSGNSDLQQSKEIARVFELLREKDFESIGLVLSCPIRINSAQQTQAAQLFIDALEMLGKVEGPISEILGRKYTKSEKENVARIIVWLLNGGLSPNALIQGEPLAHAVISNVNSSLARELGLEALIHAGADVNATSSTGKTVLGSLLSDRSISFNYTADSFLEAGAVFNRADLADHKLYETAFQCGLLRIARAIPAESLAKHVNVHGKHSFTLLHLVAGGPGLDAIDGREPIFAKMYAANGNYPVLAKMLLQAGADPATKNNAGHDAMTIAVRLHHMDTAEVLDSWVAGTDGISLSESLNTPIAGKATRLFLASFDGNVNDVEELLEHGADPNVRSFVDYDLAAEDKVLRPGVPPMVASLFAQEIAVKLRIPEKFLDMSLGLTNLHYPCLFGRSDVVHCLLEAGEDPNARSFHGLFPLYIAAEHGRLDIVMDLVEHGAEINQTTPLNCTALLNAAEEGHGDVVGYLLQMGADASIANKAGETPLDGAVRGGHTNVVDILRNALRSEGEHIAFNGAAGNDPRSAATYHSECKANEYNLGSPFAQNLTSCKALAGFNISPSMADGLEFSLQTANSEMEIGDKCLSGEATPEEKDYHFQLIAGQLSENEIEEFETGLGRQANIQHIKNTLLILAVLDESPEAIGECLSMGAQANARCYLGSESMFPLMEAAARNDLASMGILLQHGAVVNGSQRNGETALLRAVNNSHYEAAQYLIERGADTNAVAYEGITALALAEGSRMVELLLDNGADPNVPDIDGDLPLIACIDHQDWTSVELMIDAGADPFWKNKRGVSAYDRSEEVRSIVNRLGSS